MLIESYNATILTYGQTGSGKSFTINGYGKQFGLSYRTLHKLFEILELKRLESSEKIKSDTSIVLPKSDLENIQVPEFDMEVMNNEFTYVIEVSMLEIYNEQVNDLLVESIKPNTFSSMSAPSGPTPGINLDIRQSTDGCIYVPGLKLVRVCNLQDVMDVFAKGSANRATATTNLNEHSSRSHLILTVHVSTFVNKEMKTKGKLSLCDLCGSERINKSGVIGTAMKEAQHINKSLAALGDVMEALDQKSKHIPYRNSKLTYLLQDSLNGSSRTMMIVTVCPTENHSEETLFTLQFASRGKLSLDCFSLCSCLNVIVQFVILS